MNTKEYYDRVIDALALQVALLNTSDKNLYKYPIKSGRTVLALLNHDQMAQISAKTFVFKEIGFYVIVGPTRTPGYDPEVYPLEVEYTKGSNQIGDEITCGTYSEAAVNTTVPAYILTYLTEGAEPHVDGPIAK